MKLGLSLLGVIVFASLAACGPAAGPGTQNSSAAQDAQIAKLEADAELARAQAAKAQAETAKLEDEARVRAAGQQKAEESRAAADAAWAEVRAKNRRGEIKWEPAE
jgi:hypothetical protein